MNKITYTVAAILLTIIIGGAITFNATKQEKDEVHQILRDGAIKWHVAKAKKEGKTTIVVPVSIVDYLGSGSGPDTAFLNFSSVIARPVESKTYAERDAIVTWYKFKIEETLSQRPPLPDLPTVEPPQDLLPLSDDEFLIAVEGGSLSLDGVNVTANNNKFLPFNKNKRYLLFISKNPSGFANLWAGPNGVFSVTPEGRLEPHTENHHPINDEMRNRFQNSVSKLKQYLANS